MIKRDFFLETYREIPTFKATIGSLNWQIPIILKVIGKYNIRNINEVNKELVSEFLSFLNNNNREAKLIDEKSMTYEGITYEGKKAHKKYLISQLFSLAIPSSITLGLVSQQEDEEMLTFFGRKLLKYIKNNNVDLLLNDELSYDLFKKIFIYQNNKKWGIINILCENNNLDIDALIKKLNLKNIKLNVSENLIWKNFSKEYLLNKEKSGKIKNWRDSDKIRSNLEYNKNTILKDKILNAKKNKLKSFINIYDNLGLIKKNKNLYYCNTEYLNKINNIKEWLEYEEVNKTTFFKSLKDNYDKIPKKQKYVQIPLLRHLVCLDLNIPWDVFDNILIELGYEFSNHKIVLIPPITTKIWGISKGKKHYYYMSIE